MDQEFRIPTKSQERVQNRDIIHDCISNFAGHNCGQELKYYSKHFDVANEFTNTTIVRSNCPFIDSRSAGSEHGISTGNRNKSQ